MYWLLPLVFFGCVGSVADSSTIKMELLKNIDEIRKAEIDLLVVGEFTPCGDKATALKEASSTPHAWIPDKCWADIGWAPDPPVHGGYWVEVKDGAFTAHGYGPDMGDGKRIHIIGSQQKSAHVAP